MHSVYAVQKRGRFTRAFRIRSNLTKINLFFMNRAILNFIKEHVFFFVFFASRINEWNANSDSSKINEATKKPNRFRERRGCRDKSQKGAKHRARRRGWTDRRQLPVTKGDVALAPVAGGGEMALTAMRGERAQATAPLPPGGDRLDATQAPQAPRWVRLSVAARLLLRARFPSPANNSNYNHYNNCGEKKN